MREPAFRDLHDLLRINPPPFFAVRPWHGHDLEYGGFDLGRRVEGASRYATDDARGPRRECDHEAQERRLAASCDGALGDFSLDEDDHAVCRSRRPPPPSPHISRTHT